MSSKTGSSSTKPSAPPEAEVYLGTAEAMEAADLPVASAVPLLEEEDSATAAATTTTETEYPSSYHQVPTESQVAVATATEEPVLMRGLGLYPKQITCPYCHRDGKTNIHTSADMATIITIIVLLMLFWPIFWLPLVLPGCKKVEHFCQFCHRKVRTKSTP